MRRIAGIDEEETERDGVTSMERKVGRELIP